MASFVIGAMAATVVLPAVLRDALRAIAHDQITSAMTKWQQIADHSADGRIDAHIPIQDAEAIRKNIGRTT